MVIDTRFEDVRGEERVHWQLLPIGVLFFRDSIALINTISLLLRYLRGTLLGHEATFDRDNGKGYLVL